MAVLDSFLQNLSVFHENVRDKYETLKVSTLFYEPFFALQNLKKVSHERVLKFNPRKQSLKVL